MGVCGDDRRRAQTASPDREEKARIDLQRGLLGSLILSELNPHLRVLSRPLLPQRRTLMKRSRGIRRGQHVCDEMLISIGTEPVRRSTLVWRVFPLHDAVQQRRTTLSERFDEAASQLSDLCAAIIEGRQIRRRPGCVRHV